MEVRAVNLKKTYRGQTVLDIDEVTFTKGKIISVMGPNGSGKSTMLSIIAGLDSDCQGYLTYDGRPLDFDLMRRMTLAFQTPYLMKASVWDNLEYPLKLRRLSRASRHAAVNDMLARLGIDDIKRQRADRLSGGEGQRVSLGRAMIFKPQLLLLDEPTSSIDIRYTEIIEDEILRFNRETGATIIMVTHSQAQAERLSDRIIHMNRGRLEDADGVFKCNDSGGGSR